MEILQPPEWPRPSGYSNGVLAEGFIFVAGQIGWDESGKLKEGIVEQVRQALLNTVTILREAGAGADQVVRMTWYITDRSLYIEHRAEIGAVYREVMGNHYPAMAMVVVKELMEDGAVVEIETTAMRAER